MTNTIINSNTTLLHTDRQLCVSYLHTVEMFNRYINRFIRSYIYFGGPGHLLFFKCCLLCSTHVNACPQILQIKLLTSLCFLLWARKFLGSGFSYAHWSHFCLFVRCLYKWASSSDSCLNLFPHCGLKQTQSPMVW